MSDAQSPIKKNKSVTKTERYLHQLCEKTFLSLWSYPNVYRDQRESPTAEGKELCDLLVVFGNHVIIFSDKQCAFPRTGDLKVDWNRWYKRTVLKSAEQAWGAERWIRHFPDRVFLDKKCTSRLPLDLPQLSDLKVHIIVVSHEASARCIEMHGGSGSLMLNYSVPEQLRSQPFVISELDLKKTFIHVLDDTTLDIILKTQNTVWDFITYLSKKENFLRSGVPVLISGEEELLAYYLQNYNDKQEHDFVINGEYSTIFLSEGGWEEFEKSDHRQAQIEADRISYLWDDLIEEFSGHALEGTQYVSIPSSFKTTEVILRFMAKESRVQRRFLAQNFLELLKKSELERDKLIVRRRYIKPLRSDHPYYVFLVFPRFKTRSDEEYRDERSAYLQAYCRALKNRIPEAKDIIGIATEPGIFTDRRSEDALYLNAREWSEEDRQMTNEIMTQLRIPIELPEEQYTTVREYPTMSKSTAPSPKNHRNKPCPCGSGLKYKRCHGK